jgi:hypothetical protein
MDWSHGLDILAGQAAETQASQSLRGSGQARVTVPQCFGDIPGLRENGKLLKQVE